MSAPLAVLLALTPLASASQATPDLEGLGRSVVTYLEARREGRAVDEARQAVVEQVAALRAEGVDALRDPSTLERALRLAREPEEYRHERGRVRKGRFTGGSFEGEGLALAYRLPKDYDPAAADYPLILAIPDAGERPDEHIRSHWMGRPLRHGAIVVSFAMPADPAGWNQVMVRGRPGGLAHVLSAQRYATERFVVDPDRVYVAGRGAGVAAALAAGNYAPERFAGVIGRAGDASGLAPENFRNLPTCFAPGGERAEAFRDAARTAGRDNVSLLAKDDDEAVWYWMLDHPRATYPKEVRLVTGNPFPTRVAWLRVAPSAPGANASATIDRATNTIAIETEGVSHVTLYLDDELVTLDLPVRVVCNGIATELTVEPHVPSLLDMLHDGTSDGGCVYVARVVVDARGGGSGDPADRPYVVDPELEERLAKAGSDPDALWSVHDWCRASGREERAAEVARRTLRYAPDHAAARAALGHHGAEGAWFPSATALERHLRGQREEVALARGHVLHRGVWMHPDERSLASKGWGKDFATGTWLNREEGRRLGRGWTRQDLEWIEPAEAVQRDRGLWRVDGDWVGPRQADLRHARIDGMWVIPSGEVLLHTTVARSVALRAAEHMGRAIRDLERVFGAQPLLPLSVALLRDEEQYDRFAFGDPDGRRLPTHTGRLHVIHSAFFAESWFRPVDGELEHAGMGVGLWDTNAPHGDLYGVHSARLAVGLSYADAVDPSPKAVRKALTRGRDAGFPAAYRAEKQLPVWLHYGAAVYGERYFHDRHAAADADPWWARRWSLDNLGRLGGLRPLPEVFAFALDPEDREDGQKLLLEAGLVVAFVVDGGCAPVTEEHEAFRRAMVSGNLHARHVRALEQAVIEHESELLAFAGLEAR